jgi:hypothetical protein
VSPPPTPMLEPTPAAPPPPAPSEPPAPEPEPDPEPPSEPDPEPPPESDPLEPPPLDSSRPPGAWLIAGPELDGPAVMVGAGDLPFAPSSFLPPPPPDRTIQAISSANKATTDASTTLRRQ